MTNSDSNPEDEYADDEYADYDAEDREQPSVSPEIPDDEPVDDVLEQRQAVPYDDDDRLDLNRPGRSELSAASRVENDLGYDVGAQPQFLGYLVRPESLLVVQQRELLL